MLDFVIGYFVGATFMFMVIVLFSSGDDHDE